MLDLCPRQCILGTMKRRNVYIPDPLDDRLTRLSKKKDTPAAELYRRALEEFLERQEALDDQRDKNTKEN